MALPKKLAVIVNLALIATCSLANSEAYWGGLGKPPTVGLPAIPAEPPLDHSGGLSHMSAGPAIGQSALHEPEGRTENVQSSGEKQGVHKGMRAGHNVHSHAEHQHFYPAQDQLQVHHRLEQHHTELAVPQTKDNALVPAAASSKLSIREVIERGIANIGARADPPAGSFIQALSTMFSGLGKDKAKRETPASLPAPPNPDPAAVNAPASPKTPDAAAGLALPSNNGLPTAPAPAAGVLTPPQDGPPNPPTPPTPADPAPAPPPAPLSPPGSPPPASPPMLPVNGSLPPLVNPNPAPVGSSAVSPPVGSLPPPQGPAASPATPAHAVVPPAAQAPPVSNANPSSNPPSAVDTGASSHPSTLKALNVPETVPASPGAVAQNGHMGHFGTQDDMPGTQQHQENEHGAHKKGVHLTESHHHGHHKESGHRANHHRQQSQGMNRHLLNHYRTNHYGVEHTGVQQGTMRFPGLEHAGMVQYVSQSRMHTGMQQGIPPMAGKLLARPSDSKAFPMVGSPAGTSVAGSDPQQAIQRRHYQSRPNINLAPLPRNRRAVEALDRMYHRRDESSASDESSEPLAEKKTSASEALADTKPVASENPADSKPADKTDTLNSGADEKPKKKSNTEAAEEPVDLKASDKSKDDATEKVAESKPGEKSKADADKNTAEAKPAPNAAKAEASTKSKSAIKAGKHMGYSGAKGHNGVGRLSNLGKQKIPVYKPRPKGYKSKKPVMTVSDSHSSRFNPHHKMIPQIARRHELRVRNAAAEADAWADAMAAYANYLQAKDVYTEKFAKRKAYAYPEVWACSDPSGCN